MKVLPPGVMHCTDQGDDNGADKFETPLMWWRLMKKFSFGVFFHIWHAAGQSYLNRVERVMSILNRGVNGAFLQSVLPGDSVPANEQPDLSDQQKKTKFKKLFDEFIFPFLGTAWSSLTALGRKIIVRFLWPSVLYIILFYFILFYFILFYCA